AGPRPFLELYRQANSYAHLLDEALEVKPDDLSGEGLRARAWPLVESRYRAGRERTAGLYEQFKHTGQARTAHELKDVLTAAHQGQIQFLFVALGREQWGTFDPATQRM